MSARDNGGPAFPLPSALVSQMLAVCELLPQDSAEKVAEQVGAASSGMTLRDAFALAALPSIIRNNQSPVPNETLAPKIAASCYEMADAMLKARSA